ncbi:MAG: FAD-dependent oxidoreductase [Acidimicrobiales bacterium]
MSTGHDDDLSVDVLVLGAGIQGLYVARSLQRTYSVCVLSDPAVASETLDSVGYLSAGYEGNDAARMQPARRAAGFWRLWAESNGVPISEAPTVYAVPSAEALSRPRLWLDAMLQHTLLDRLPDPFVGGSLEGDAVYALGDDVVVNPAAVLTKLREGLEPFCIEGSILRVVLAADTAVDHVQVEIGDRVLTIAPRFVVLAAGVGNAALLSMVAKRFRDQSSRRERLETARTSQAVRRSTVICIRGEGLPLVSGWFGGLSVVAQPLASGDVAWLVSAPIDDHQTVLGVDDTRFELPVASSVVADTVARLVAMSPMLRRQVDELRWGAYTGRRVQHPSLAGPSTAEVATPVPAKLEAFGLEGLLALWPSHLSYSMILGDVAVERITDALGSPQQYSGGLRVEDLAAPPAPLRARWDRDDFPWCDWSTFASTHGIELGAS